jgi:Uncharacterised conserved protein
MKSFGSTTLFSTFILVCFVVVLRHHWIDPFVTSLSQQLREIERFTLKLDRLRVYTNDERTRTFVGLEASGGVKQLNKISQVDQFMLNFHIKGCRTGRVFCGTSSAL